MILQRNKRTTTEGIISLHFDGDIVIDHQVTARTLGKLLTHTQNAIDRAYLDLKYGNLWKYARIHGEDYEEADFITLYPEKGGFIQKLQSDIGKKIIDRLSLALAPAMERVERKGDEVASSIIKQVENRKDQIQKGLIEPSDYQQLIEHPDKKVVRKYADRSINREFDQILTIIRSPHAGVSILEINAVGNETRTYTFNKSKSEIFHQIVSRREIGMPVIYNTRVLRLDKDMLNGKVVNLENDLKLSIFFSSEEDFLKVHPYLGNNEEMVFIGAPLIEYGAFDPKAGDVYFIDLMK